jgi:GDP/UDP-N,N'-diacetylbacillosamine 2-epimerase (hydrolysing)
MIQSNNKNFFFITGSRAEFGIFEYFLKKLSTEKKINISLIVTGSFLEKGFETDFQDIIKSKLLISKKIKLGFKSKNIIEKTPQEISSGIKKFASFFIRKRPDYIMIPGDRYEMLCPAFAAFFLKIPIIHFYGGETSIGSFDNTIRDQISLMSQYHFVSNKNHAKKIFNLGIDKSKIFNVGALALDRLNKIKLFTKKKIKNIFKDFFVNDTALMTFHPVTNGDTKMELTNIIKALNKAKNLKVLFTGPNNDPHNQIILTEIKLLIKKNPEKYFFQRHLGRDLYFSFVKNVDFNMGNSSSLLYEVPMFKKLSINIGDRQKNRTAGPSVINIKAKEKLISKIFKIKKNKKISFFNPYYKKNSVQKTIKILKKL